MKQWMIHVVTTVANDDLAEVGQQCAEVCRILKEHGFTDPQGSVEPMDEKETQA